MTSISFESTATKRARSRRGPSYAPQVTAPPPVAEGARRGLNFVVAAVGLVITFPLMLLVAVALRLTSRGPILYTQTRVGLDRRGSGWNVDISRRRSNMGGRPFTIYKFRTMALQPLHQEGEEVWATPDDPRVTPVGRVLRKYRLDELPQLWNVLRGDMNVVGPRPEQPSLFLDLRKQIDGYDSRQRVRPGITGWAQVNHSYDQCLDDVRRKVSLDLEYISRQSFAEDLKIMALTVPVMVFRKGAW